jgi:hypothetical protein
MPKLSSSSVLQTASTRGTTCSESFGARKGIDDRVWLGDPAFAVAAGIGRWG